MQAVYALWEGSWADDAVKRDRVTGLYADPAGVREVHHHGPYYRVDAIHLCEPSPQRTPVLYQAGSSGRGKRFAGRACGVRVPEWAGQGGGARACGRDTGGGCGGGAGGGDVLAFVGATVIVAETEALAQAKLADYRRYASAEAALVHASASMGVDLDRFGMDEAFGAAPTEAIASNLQAMAQQGMTKRKLLGRMVLGSRQAPIVGSASAVADELMAWVAEADVDGFILSRTVTPECFADFIDLVVPELQRRGVIRRSMRRGLCGKNCLGRGRGCHSHIRRDGSCRQQH